MPIRAFADLNCSIAKPLSILGERWALLVIRDISLGRRRFDVIQGSLAIPVGASCMNTETARRAIYLLSILNI